MYANVIILMVAVTGGVDPTNMTKSPSVWDIYVSIRIFQQLLKSWNIYNINSFADFLLTSTESTEIRRTKFMVRHHQLLPDTPEVKTKFT